MGDLTNSQKSIVTERCVIYRSQALIYILETRHFYNIKNKNLMETSKLTPITVDPKGGEILSVVGGNYRILVSGKQTNGAFSTI